MLGSLTQGATLSVPLNFSVASGSDGDYLVADFDFGTRFTSIEQVMLEFVLPSGFESVSSTTGNSSYTSKITYALLEDPVALEGVLTHKTSGNAIPGPTHVLLNIPAGEEGSYPLFSHLFYSRQSHTPTSYSPVLVPGERRGWRCAA